MLVVQQAMHRKLETACSAKLVRVRAGVLEDDAVRVVDKWT